MGECQRQLNSQGGLRLPVPRLGDVGLFEVDEATVPSALQHIQQDRSLACEEVQYLLEFIRSSSRGVILRRARRAEEVLADE